MDTGVRTEEVSRVLLDTTYTKKIDCKNYWDSHGHRVECAPTQYKFDRLKKVELFRVIRKFNFTALDPKEFEFLELLVEGKKLQELGEITSYQALKTKVKLDCCVGAG